MQRRRLFSPGLSLVLVLFFLIYASDFQLRAADPETPPDTTAPKIELLVPTAESTVRELNTVELHFTEAVQGVEAADLLINGVAATNVQEVVLGHFVFTFPQPPDGIVTVAWRPDHGIADRATNAFVGGRWTYNLDTTSPATGVIITEFMADNTRTINDEDGENSDWIELFNAGDTTANLDGWFLTDDANNLAKWRFPDVAIPSKGFLLIFASEKNRTNSPGRLHTNFRLSATGEYLALVTPATNVVSHFAPAYPRQWPDVSYGRVQGAPLSAGYFERATPGTPNAGSGKDFAPAVEFSEVSQTFVTPFQLTLSTRHSNAVIRYTLDGNLPTNSSPAYVGPIPITNSVQVRARAFQTGLLPGPPRTETFLLLSNNVLSFTSDLPVIVIHSLGRGAPTASRQNFAHVSVFEPVRGVTSLTNRPTLATRTGIKIRGSSTEGLAKSSWALELWDEFNLDDKREFLGLPAESDWVLYAPNVYDPPMIHNPFIHQLSRDMGRYSSRTRFVEVYLNRGSGPVAATNYNGIYVLEEKIKIGKNRVDIDKLEAEHVNPPEVTGGYLVKVDRVDPGDTGFGAGGQSMAYVDPKEPIIKLPQRDPQEQYIRNYFNEFNRVLTGTNWLDPKLGYRNYIELEKWVEFHILEVLSGNVDSMVLSTYLYKPRHGKIIYGPHWDFDRALGSTDGRDANPRLWNTGPFFTAWWTRIFRDTNAWQLWIDRYQELRQTHLSLTNMHGLIDRLAGQVRQAQPRERQRWRTTYRGGSYQSEINLMKNWLSNRVDFIDRQLAQPPALSALGGRVTPGFTVTLAASTNATIYYTLDGSDPRQPPGFVSPAAKVYSGPIVINGNVRLVARANDPVVRQRSGPPISSPWSGPVAATFTVAPPPLLLTEIMFHPAALAGSANSADAFEFLELKNIGGAALDLVGYRFTNGIQFAFTSASSVTNLAPGGRVLLVKSRAAFASRYPNATNIAGEFAGSLSDGGSRLTMVGPVLEPVFDVRYRDDWQPLADGFGFSLVLADETVTPEQLNDGARWRLSSRVGGSPGEADAPRAVLPRIFVNELLANPAGNEGDRIELFNDETTAVSVAGWFISDDFRSPKKFRIAGGTLIPPKGYVALDSLKSTAPPLAFSKSGEEVFLFSADSNGNLTGWFHGFGFGAVEPGVSLGRHLDSAGRESFVSQTTNTFGAPNAGPLIGPVVVSEIMFEPVPLGSYNNTTDEFIEIHNRTAAPAPLFDPIVPLETWRIRGAVEFDFPTNTVLPPAGYVVVVGFDPASDLPALAAFRARYGLTPATPLLGPWTGRLNNSGDTIRLLRPGRRDNATNHVPHVLAEQIAYSRQTPWPTDAAATGRSLQRRDVARFADDPANWAAVLPSPGDADADADGLPDRWELSHNLNPNAATGADGRDGDRDGDGFVNWQEFLGGTSPNDRNSFLRLSGVKGASGAMTLSFATAPGRTYTVEYRDSFTTNSWQALRVIVAPSNGGQVELIDAPAPSRFYRLATP